MAGPYYVRSGAGGGATGADWANAFLTLAAANTAMVAGDTTYVAEDHAESTAGAITLNSPGTNANPCFVYCVNHSGSVPPVSADLRTSATISTTGASNIVFGAQTTYVYGCIFQSGSVANTAAITIGSASNATLRFDSCGFTINNTSNSSRLNLGAGGGLAGIKLEFHSCTFTFGSSTSQGFVGGGGQNVTATIIGGAVVVGANVPTSLFLSTPPVFNLIGFDMSVLGSGKTLFATSVNTCRVVVQDCKFGASVTVAATPTSLNQEIYIVRSDNGNTNYNQQKYHYTGTQTVETTIVRTGGASDGTTPISWKIVPSANSKWILPYECIPITIWNNTITPTTFTVTLFGTSSGGSVPDNATVWMDIEGLGTASFPLGTITTTGKADNLAAAGSNTADGSSTWGGGVTPFKIVSGAITMQAKGYLNIYVKVVTSAGTPTIYIDPLVVLT